jgi:hypothetical protein
MMARRTFHRRVFLAAGLYNLAWGLFTALDPQWQSRRIRSDLIVGRENAL